MDPARPDESELSDPFNPERADHAIMETIEIATEGEDCDECVRKLRPVLMKINGVRDVIVDLGFEMRGQTLQSARRRSAALARVRDFEVRQSGGAQFFGQQRRIRLSRAQPEARRQTVTENKNSFHCRRIARRGGNGWRG